MANKNKHYFYPKRIKSILEGETPVVKVGYEKPNKNIVRDIGERWTDNDGNTWEQKEGYIAKVPKIEGVRVPLFCPKCKKPMGKSSKDSEVYWKFGFCFKCLLERDFKMIEDGTFPEFEKNYMNSKKRGYYMEMKQQIEEYLNTIKDGKIEFVQEDGSREKWTGDVKKLQDFWTKELEFVNKELEKLTRENKENINENQRVE